MFSSLVLGAALAAPAAPVPRDATPGPVSPPPWVLYLKADQNGRVVLTAYTSQKVTMTRSVAENKNGKTVVRQVQEEITRMVPRSTILNEQAAKFTTAGGTTLDAGQVLKGTREGIVVLVSADGKAVDKAWLRAVNPDTIVMASDLLKESQLPPVSAARLSTTAPRLVLLGTDSKGKVSVYCNPNGNASVTGRSGRAVFINNGAGGLQQVFLEDSFTSAAVAGDYSQKPLKDINFDAYDLSGKKVAREIALKRLQAGGLVLMAGDNRFPDESYLKAFQGELLVLVSPELVNVPLNPKGIPAGQPLPVPAVRPGILRIAPAVIPAKPLPLAPAAKPAKEVKPVPAPAQKPAPAAPARANQAVPLPARAVPAVPLQPRPQPAKRELPTQGEGK